MPTIEQHLAQGGQPGLGMGEDMDMRKLDWQTARDVEALQALDADALAIVVGVRPMVVDGGSADAWDLYCAADARLWQALLDARWASNSSIIGHPEGNPAVAYLDAIGALSGVPAHGR